MLSLKSTSTSLRMFQSSKDFLTRMGLRSFKISQTWWKAIFELTTMSKTAFSPEFRAVFTHSNGTKSMLTSTRFITKYSKKEQSKWILRCLSTQDQSLLKTVVSTWSVDVTSEEISTLRNATDTTRSSPNLTRRHQWFIHMPITLCVQWRDSSTSLAPS